MKKIQIFTCYHKAGVILKSDIIEPIHVGKALSNAELNILCDNIGDNISEKNRFFCELTATYFIWKNIKADYVGLFHYRRFFNFKTADEKTNRMNGNFLNEFGITRENIEKYLTTCDVLLPRRTKRISRSLYTHYAQRHVISDLDILLDVIAQKYPNMLDGAQKHLKKNSQGYFANMIIASKSFFDGYAAWLFDILFEVEKRIQADVLTRDTYQQRVYGFLSERMMGIYSDYMQRTQGIKVKELPILFVEDDQAKWKKYKSKMFRRKILTFLGLGKKSWKM